MVFSLVLPFPSFSFSTEEVAAGISVLCSAVYDGGGREPPFSFPEGGGGVDVALLPTGVFNLNCGGREEEEGVLEEEVEEEEGGKSGGPRGERGEALDAVSFALMLRS